MTLFFDESLFVSTEQKKSRLANTHAQIREGEKKREKSDKYYNLEKMSSAPYNYDYILKYIIIGDQVSFFLIF